MLSLIYSEILKMLRMWGILEFDVEIFYPHDSHGCPRGYQKQKSTESDQTHIMTTQSLLEEVNCCAHILFILNEMHATMKFMEGKFVRITYC